MLITAEMRRELLRTWFGSGEKPNTRSFGFLNSGVFLLLYMSKISVHSYVVGLYLEKNL